MADHERSAAPDDVIEYLGPYENWNFGAGYGYTLPMMRDNTDYISALAELRVGLRQTAKPPSPNAWLPTLWQDGFPLTFIPFVVANPHHAVPTSNQLSGLLQSGFEIVATQVEQLNSEARPQSSELRQATAIEPSRFRVAFPIPNDAMHTDINHVLPPRPDWQPDKGLRERIGDKRITVIAVIDDGLPFAHRNFRDPTGKRTRVEFCWLQSVTIDPDQKSVRFGREYVRKQIEHYIAQHGDDEDTLYRVAGATADSEELGSLIDRHATHGAHVMDLATGYAPERGQPPNIEMPHEEIRIIAVQLPNTIAWDTSGFGKDMYMLSAFHYIFDRADMIAQGYGIENLRLVINFSYGFSGGRHDGQTELEAAIDELVCKRRKIRGPTALVLPSGNTFLDRLHGLIYPEDFHHGIARFHWRIQPNDRTPSYLELWFWSEFDPHGYQIQLFDPWGDACATLDIQIPASLQGPGDPCVMSPVQRQGEEPIGQISVDQHRAGTDRKIARYRVLIIVAPTEPENPALPRAVAGRWTVAINHGAAALIDKPIHCWIQRSADPESLRSGSRQSYFDDPTFEKTRFTAQGDFSEEDTAGTFVKRFGSINGLATGQTSLVVGGYRLGAGLGSSLTQVRPARYSSAGVLPKDGTAEEPDMLPCPEGPRDLAAWPQKRVNASSMSERSRALPGTIAAGVRSGSLSLVQGTSSAAPFVARQLAERFVEASDAEVDSAAGDNYRPLLRGCWPNDPHPPRNGEALTRRDTPAPCCGQDDTLIRARLGKVRVLPDWQPGVDPSACHKTE